MCKKKLPQSWWFFPCLTVTTNRIVFDGGIAGSLMKKYTSTTEKFQAKYFCVLFLNTRAIQVQHPLWYNVNRNHVVLLIICISARNAKYLIAKFRYDPTITSWCANSYGNECTCTLGYKPLLSFTEPNILYDFVTLQN